MAEPIRTVLINGLVVVALSLLAVAGAGLIVARKPLTRLHFLAPASTLALPCLGIAAVINSGLTLGSAAIALTVATGALSAPVLTTSIARLVAAEDSERRDRAR